MVQISHPGELMGVLNSYDHIWRYTELQLFYAEDGKDTTLVRRHQENRESCRHHHMG